VSGGIINQGQTRVTFTNTIVGDNASMTVNQQADVRRELENLLAAIEAHREDLPDEVAREAATAEAEIARPEPRRDRVAQAMERIREAAGSVTAVANAAGAVLRALGVA
jgi:hypothetical protein